MTYDKTKINFERDEDNKVLLYDDDKFVEITDIGQIFKFIIKQQLQEFIDTPDKLYEIGCKMFGEDVFIDKINKQLISIQEVKDLGKK